MNGCIMSKTPYRVKSLKRALDILNLFTSAHNECSVSEIARKMHMHKSTVTRVMSTLASENIVEKSNANRQYRLGGRLWELAEVYLSKLDLRTTALPYLRELRAQTDETVCLFGITKNDRICLERLESSQFVRPALEIGQHAPLTAGAPGKVMLAYLSPNKRNELIGENGLPRYTEHTITTREELEKELDKIRNQGFAVSHGEYIEYCTTVAAPIRNYTGEVIASVAITGLIMRFTTEMEKKSSILVKPTIGRFLLIKSKTSVGPFGSSCSAN